LRIRINLYPFNIEYVLGSELHLPGIKLQLFHISRVRLQPVKRHGAAATRNNKVKTAIAPGSGNAASTYTSRQSPIRRAEPAASFSPLTITSRRITA